MRMADQIAFLNARLDETQRLAQAYLDHAVARKRPGPERWAYQLLLREIEAKRAITERYERACAVPESAVSFAAGQDDGYRQACMDVIRYLATVYSDHPDWRAE